MSHTEGLLLATFVCFLVYNLRLYFVTAQDGVARGVALLMVGMWSALIVSMVIKAAS